MWILNFLPNWIFHLLGLAGIFAIFASYFLRIIPIVRVYTVPVRLAGVALIVTSVFFEGAVWDNDAWVAKVKELEARIAIAEEESREANKKLEEKLQEKAKVIMIRGNTITQYIDRELVKYDTKFIPGGICEIPKEFIKAHNDAAKGIR